MNNAQLLTRSHPAVQPELTVYYDGSCPLCTREISYYRRLDTAARIMWEDVARENASCPLGYDRLTLLQRFHVKELASGAMFHGAAAFARLWCTLPSPWRWLGRLALCRPVTWLLEAGYRFSLLVRPWLTRRTRTRR